MRFPITASAAVALAAFAFAPPASAAPKHHGSHAAKATSGTGSVRFARRSARGSGYQTLVTDGEGSGYGFHRLPYPYRAAARVEEDRQSDALRSAVDTDALTSGDWDSGYLGSNVYSYGNNAAYGVYNGSDGYGSPYFAGYYGPGDGEDYGPFGRAYTN